MHSIRQRRRSTRWVAMIAVPAIVGAHVAYAADEAVRTSPVVVTATRAPQSSFDLPVSIDAVEGEQITEAQPLLNAAEALARVPGLVAPNQYRLSSDQQLSSRGFGARAAFGVRQLAACLPQGFGLRFGFTAG